jgi:hypothetical protein
MASGRRSESLKHLLTVALGMDESDKPFQMIVGNFKCRTPADLAKLKPETFEKKFQFTDKNGVVTQEEMAEAEIMLLCDLQELVKANKGDINMDWTSVTEDEFEQFRDNLVEDADLVKAQNAAQAAAAAQTAAMAQTTAAGNAQTNTGGRATSMLTAYKMKRLYTDYKDITKRHFFTQWFKEVKVTAHTHCCVNLLNPTYVPANQTEQDVFDADNMFMFNVAAKTVKYPLGKTIIQKHLDDMNGQQTFIELTTDATGEIVTKINEHKLEDALRKMEAHPDKWNRTGESFLDAFETKLVQLNDSRDKPVDDKDVRDWLTHCLRGHPAAVAAINQQRQLEIYQREVTPNYMRTFGNFMNSLRISLQQYDDENKPKQTLKNKNKQEEERRANALKHKADKQKATPEEFERFKKELQELGMWLEGDTYKKMTSAQKKAHHEKLKVMRGRKQGAATQANAASQAQTATPPANTPTSTPPPTYAQAANTTGPTAANPPAIIVQHNRTYRLCTAIRTYHANNKSSATGSLIDGGCNGGLAGADVLILDEHSFGRVDIIGVANNLIKAVPLCTAAGLIETSKGPINGIMHNYAALGTGGSIHSSVQLKDHGILVDDTPRTQKRFDGEFGTQTVRIPTDEDDVFFDVELNIVGGLAYFQMQPPTQEQMDDASIPHVHLTSDMEWDPANMMILRIHPTMCSRSMKPF